MWWQILCKRREFRVRKAMRTRGGAPQAPGSRSSSPRCRTTSKACAGRALRWACHGMVGGASFSIREAWASISRPRSKARLLANPGTPGMLKRGITLLNGVVFQPWLWYTRRILMDMRICVVAVKRVCGIPPLPHPALYLGSQALPRPPPSPTPPLRCPSSGVTTAARRVAVSGPQPP